MKKLLFASVIALTIALPIAAFAGSGTQDDPLGPGDKVTFCHYDGSETGGGSGKYNMPNASATATGPAGHIGHSFDVIPSYYFQQNANAEVTFYAGVNWPTLTNLPTSPVDFSALLGTSASAFIASGCAAPVVSTSTATTPPPTTSTPPPSTTTPPPTTSTTTTSTSTTAPPTTTTTPPPTGHTNPPNHHNNPPKRLAFTGPSTPTVVGLSVLTLILLVLGIAALFASRRSA